VIRSPCPRPLAVESLVDYWAGALTEAEEAPLEEHLFACDACARRLRAVSALARGVADLARRRGGLRMGLTPSLAHRLASEGLRIREYRAAPGQSVPCAVGRHDDLVVTRFAADLRGVERVDLTITTGGQLLDRVSDLPIDRDTSSVILADAGETMRAWPAMTLVLRLVAVEAAGERTVGEYTFEHAGVVDD
jgi:anti-sigma factor RsiW